MDHRATYSRRSFLSLSIAAASAVILSGLPSCQANSSSDSDPSTIQRRTARPFVFDTFVELDASCNQETLNQAVKRCFYFESIFSRTIPSSDISKINCALGAPVKVHKETADIIQKAATYSEASRGFFDITIGAVSTLWDFKAHTVPAHETIEEALTHVDYTQVVVEDEAVTLLDPYAKLDLGGIAKGYIADDLARFFVQAGCSSACINLGGNVRTIGNKPDGSPWRIGIQDPHQEFNTLIASLDVQDGSVVTSGLYERQFTQNNTQYWHILDPRTGYPVVTDLASVSIISDYSLDGDGYSKPPFMMPVDDALNWIENLPNIEGFLVDSKGKIQQTSGQLCAVAEEKVQSEED